MTAAAPLSRIIVARFAGNPSRGFIAAGGLHAPCALGRAGTRHAKHEGDGATPTGAFYLRAVLYRPDRLPRPRTRLPVTALDPAAGWCDDPSDRAYNHPRPPAAPGKPRAPLAHRPPLRRHRRPRLQPVAHGPRRRQRHLPPPRHRRPCPPPPAASPSPPKPCATCCRISGHEPSSTLADRTRRRCSVRIGEFARQTQERCSLGLAAFAEQRAHTRGRGAGALGRAGAAPSAGSRRSPRSRPAAARAAQASALPCA